MINRRGHKRKETLNIKSSPLPLNSRILSPRQVTCFHRNNLRSLKAEVLFDRTAVGDNLNALRLRSASLFQDSDVISPLASEPPRCFFLSIFPDIFSEIFSIAVNVWNRITE